MIEAFSYPTDMIVAAVSAGIGGLILGTLGGYAWGYWQGVDDADKDALQEQARISRMEMYPRTGGRLFPAARERSTVAHHLPMEPADADEMFVEEDYCDYCERSGHTFRSCPKRDDEDR